MANELINTLTCTNLNQINHTKNAYNCTLDLALSNILNIKSKRTHGIVDEDQHHPTIAISFDSKEIKFMKQKKTIKLNFFKADYESINKEISEVDWNVILCDQDINNNVEIFYNKLNEIINKYAPKVKIDGSKFPIWYSKELIRLIKEKEYYFKRKKQSVNPIFKLLFERKRSEIKRRQKRLNRI